VHVFAVWRTGLSGPVIVLQAGTAVNYFGTGLILPFEIIYLHEVRGFPTATAGAGRTDLGFGGWERPPTLELHDLQLRLDVTGGVHGCQSSVMTTLPLAWPCSTYASASRVWSNGNVLSMTGRRWPAS
jgi:hypothetical protein